MALVAQQLLLFLLLVQYQEYSGLLYLGCGPNFAPGNVEESYSKLQPFL